MLKKIQRSIIIGAYLVISCFGALRAQNENRIWYYGPTSLGFQFAPVTNNITVLNNKYSPYSGEGCSVAVHPSTGQLMFYTNGIKVIDASHQVMPNGSGLIGHASSAQSGRVCPKPGNCNQYYVFHNNADMAAGTLYYSIIDMTLPGNGTSSNPKGDVVAGSKNVLVTSQVSEALVIVPSTTLDEYWLLVPLIYTDDIKIYKITSTGIAFISTFNTGYSMQDQRSLRYSGANGKLALMSLLEADVSLIIDFDAATGQLANPSVIPGTPMGTSASGYWGMYDCEWSPDGSKLYLSKYRVSSGSGGGKLYQYDLNTPATLPTLIYSVSTNATYTARGLKCGPDGRIYFLYNSTLYNNTRLVGVINSPNLAGAACNFNAAGLDMGIDQGNVHKFPEFIAINNHSPVSVNDIAVLNISGCYNTSDTIFTNPLVNDTDPDGDTLSLAIISGPAHGYATLLAGNVVEYINAPGFSGPDTITYLACDNQCFSKCDTGQIIITVNQNNTFQPGFLGSNIVLCQGQSTQLTAPPGYQYTWSTGATSQSITVNSSGSFSVQLNSSACTGADTVSVQVNPVPQAVIAGTSTICSGQTATLTASGGTSYQWSGGSSATTSSITVTPSATTTYYVTTFNGQCTSQPDTFTLQVLTSPVVNVTGITSICSGQTTTLTASGASSYQWSGGSSATTASITVMPTSTTTYYVIGDNGICPSQPVSVTVQVIPMPTINASGNTQICAGQSTTLTATGGSTYQWSGGSNATTSSIVVAPVTSTTYYVTASNGNCVSPMAQLTINVTPSPNASIIGPTSSCAGVSSTLSAFGGTTYQWSTGSFSSNITVNPSVTTTYNVIVYNAAGCTDTAYHTINANQPVAAITGNAVCAGNSVTLVGSGGGNYQWSTGATTSSITITPATVASYSLVVTDQASGCTDTAYYTQSILAQPVAGISGPGGICTGGTANLTAFGGGNYLWNTGAITAGISASPAATSNYSVIVTDPSGCSDTAYFTLTVYPPVTASAGNDTTICLGDSVQLNGYVTGAINSIWNPLIYLSNASLVNPWASPTVTTTYILRAYNAYDCEGRDTVVITVQNCTGIEEVEGAFISVVPNPANDYIELVMNAPVKETVIAELYNMQGQIVQKVNVEPVAGEERMDVSELARGLYFMKINCGNRVKTLEIILQ